MKGWIAAALLIALAPASVWAQTVDYAKSQITFAGKQMGVPTQGHFNRYSVNLKFDPKQPETAKIEADIDLRSIDTGANETDTEVKKPAWLNISAFPNAKFVTDAVKQLAPGRYEASGKLSIKGIGQDVHIPFTAQATGDVTVFDGAFTLLRLQFKVGEGIWADTDTVANEVQVRFHLVARGALERQAFAPVRRCLR